MHKFIHYRLEGADIFGELLIFLWRNQCSPFWAQPSSTRYHKTPYLLYLM